ncbi:MAG: hypothetical protein IT370_06835 [Deltaproteobacteria bacterium]|nr:hypothetical protein [Deltaproteobacteria bacterium]
MRCVAITALLLVISTVSAFARAPSSPASRLAAAADDPALADVLAARLLPAQVARALRGRDDATLRGALAVAAQLPEGLAVLPELVTLAAGKSAHADAALTVAARLVKRSLEDPSERIRLAPGSDERDAFIVAVIGLAQRSELPAARRAAALELTTTLLATGSDAERTLLRVVQGGLLADREPLLRRAAAELADADDAALLPRLTAALADSDDTVALAAALQLCRSQPRDLGEPASARVRAAVLDPARPVSEMLGLMPCLRAHASAEDAVALRSLRKHRSPSVKRLAAALAFKAK